MPIHRSAALAIVLGTLMGLVTMGLHPTGEDVVRNAAGGATNALAAGVHWLAVLAQPLLLAGTLALTLRLRARRDLAVGAYAFFAIASVAVVVAAVASGFVAPAVLQGLQAADAATHAQMMGALRYTGLLNQAFATLFVGCSGVAILLWSAAILAGGGMSRALAALGVPLGAALLTVAATGILPLDIHGFGAVVLGEGAWMTWAAAELWRGPAGAAGSVVTPGARTAPAAP